MIESDEKQKEDGRWLSDSLSLVDKKTKATSTNENRTCLALSDNENEIKTQVNNRRRLSEGSNENFPSQEKIDFFRKITEESFRHKKLANEFFNKKFYQSAREEYSKVRYYKYI